MDTIRRLQAVAATSTFEQRFNGNTMLMDVIGLKENEVEFHVTIQEPHPDGAIQVYEEHVREVSFPVAQVTQELEKHFIILDAFASHRQTLSRADRVYFICRKP
jgi:hypothetical protein